MTNELKPCPFCGCKEIGFDDHLHFCEDCGCMPTGDWNTREQQWIPVSERYPECQQSVLVYSPRHQHTIPQGIYSAVYWGDDTFGDMPIGCVTHWMPLPDAAHE